MAVFYRYVSEAEYRDLEETGRFRESPSGAAGKWFTDSREAARRWGDQLEQLELEPHSGRVIRFEVPDEDVSNFTYLGDNYEGISATWFATIDQLANARIRVIDDE